MVLNARGESWYPILYEWRFTDPWQVALLVVGDPRGLAVVVLHVGPAYVPFTLCKT